MNELGMLLVGAAVRCSALALLGVGLYELLRRRSPSGGALAALGALLVLTVVSALSLSPWPRWWTLSARGEGQRVISSDEPSAVPKAATSAPPEAGATRPAPPPRTEGESVGAAFLRTLWSEAWRPAPAPARRWSWHGWCAAAFVAGATAGLLRLALALHAIEALRRGSRPIDDPEIRDLADQLRAEMGCARPVALGESTEVLTPATVGWLYPMILLPGRWRDWDETERRVVLAHELAHVCRNDYLAGLLARLSLALHFYHPLAHWLLDRLRLQQELAADAWGARLAGGRPVYLTTLAQMALRQAEPAPPASWPARAFLPSRGTFLRRIEMLRDAKDLASPSISRTARIATLCTLLVSGVLIAGVRGGDEPARPKLLAQAAPPQAGPGRTDQYDLRYVPAATDALVAFRPAMILERPGFKTLVETLKRESPDRGLLSLPLEQMDQVLVLWLRPEGGAEVRLRGGPSPIPQDSTTIFRSGRIQDWNAVATRLLGPTGAREHLGQGYRIASEGARPLCYFTPDDQTLIVASEPDVRFLIESIKGPRTRPAWQAAWEQVEKKELTLAAGAGWLGQRLGAQSGRQGRGGDPTLGAIEPLWTSARAYAAALDLSRGLSVELIATCGSDASAAKVEETTRAVLTLLGNLLDGFQQRIAAAPRSAVVPMQMLADAAEPLLTRAVIRRDVNVVTVRSTTNLDLEGFAQVLMPAIRSARVAASRAMSVNNLKQLGLAMHNFAANHNGKFPPAVVIGPDGKTPHSWRVELLPYLEQQSLYKRYRFDEPWDGPNNRKLIDEMPAVFADPTGSREHRRLAYFVLTGKDTAFGVEGGTGFTNITDGTSNTIMVVEARRDIPWTKPEDIPYDATKPVPELGGLFPGGFDGLFADGSVRFFKSSINEKILRALFTRAGGEVISADQF